MGTLCRMSGMARSSAGSSPLIVPTDDQANWNHPSGNLRPACPHEEGTDHAGVISVIVRDGNGGAVKCIHEGSGDGEHDCNIYGEEIEDCIIDMRLFDGMNGGLPPDEDEAVAARRRS